MDKIVFIIENHGDPSVGIASFTAKVTLDDPIGYDDEDIQQIRKMLADHYDTPFTNVYTEDEWKAFIKAEHEAYKHIWENKDD